MTFVMRLSKTFIKCVFPKKLVSLIHSLKIIKQAYKHQKSLNHISFNRVQDDTMVVGMGPSLENDIDRVLELAKTHDRVCVNNFSQSQYYEKLAPSMYVLLDGYFFRQEVHDDWKRQRVATFEAINKKTSWKMQLLLPYGADRGILDAYIHNHNVEIVDVWVKPLFIDCLTNFNSWLLRSGYFGPADNNVLIYAVYYSIWAGYKNIRLFGADMSIYRSIDINQLNNQLIMTSKHFNMEDESYPLKTGPLKVHSPTYSEMQFSSYRVFKQHEILRMYADKMNIRILNHSSYSLIDAYERSK